MNLNERLNHGYLVMAVVLPFLSDKIQSGNTDSIGALSLSECVPESQLARHLVGTGSKRRNGYNGIDGRAVHLNVINYFCTVLGTT